VLFNFLNRSFERQYLSHYCCSIFHSKLQKRGHLNLILSFKCYGRPRILHTILIFQYQNFQVWMIKKSTIFPMPMHLALSQVKKPQDPLDRRVCGTQSRSDSVAKRIPSPCPESGFSGVYPPAVLKMQVLVVYCIFDGKHSDTSFFIFCIDCVLMLFPLLLVLYV